MPDTLASFESNSILSNHAAIEVNGRRPKVINAQPRAASVQSSGDECEALELWRQLQIAEEKLNATIEDADDALVEAYHEAQDRFTDSEASSLKGILLKLLRIEEVENLDAELEAMPRLLWPRLLRSAIRDLKAQVDSASHPARQCEKSRALGRARAIEPLLSPTTFIARAIDAVAPLVDADSEGLAEGKTEDDVVLALAPLCGHFAVADGVLASIMLEASEDVIEPASDDASCARSYARFLVWQALTTFSCTAWASSGACAGARLRFLKAQRPEGGSFGDANEKMLRFMLTKDMSDLRGDSYTDETFGREYEGGLPQWHRRSMAPESTKAHETNTKKGVYGDPMERLWLDCHKAYAAYNAAAQADPDWGGKNEKAETKQAEKAMHAADDALMEHSTTSLLGILCKLEFIVHEEIEKDAEDQVGRTINGLIRDLKRELGRA